MKLLAISSALLLAGTSIAAPGTALRRERALHNRTRSSHQTRPLIPVEGPVSLKSNNTQYSGNWAGAILIGTGYTSVTGTFTIPTPSSSGSGSAWVGIDGDTCGTAILQTGVDWTKSGSSITYDAWYEWFPANAINFSPSAISLKAGDSITATVKATSKTGGTATLTNHRTSQTVTHTFRNEGSEGDLCETNAEWIVEDFDSGGSQVSFADFGTVEFTGCSAVQSGSNVGTTGATIIDIKQSSTVLTDCSVGSSSEVKCTYV